MKILLKIFLIIISLLFIWFGYATFEPILLAMGLILFDNTLLTHTKFFSRYVIEFTTLSVMLISIFHGLVIGVAFAITMPTIFHMFIYIMLRNDTDALLPPVTMSTEKISYVVIAIITTFVQPFLPFVILVVMMTGLQLTILAARELLLNKLPNFLAIGVTLVVTFYIAQFLEQYATTILSTVV